MITLFGQLFSVSNAVKELAHGNILRR
jgi:hypothetical protein